MSDIIELPDWRDVPVVQVGPTCVAASVTFAMCYNNFYKAEEMPWNKRLHELYAIQDVRSYGVMQRIPVPGGWKTVFAPNYSAEDKIQRARNLLQKSTCALFAFASWGLKRYSNGSGAHAMPLVKITTDGFSFRDLNFPVGHSNELLLLTEQEIKDLHNDTKYLGHGRDMLWFEKT